MIDGDDPNSTHSTKGTYTKILSQQTEDRRSSEDLITDDNQPNKDNDESINTNIYQLVRDREPRTKIPATRFCYADLIEYALSMTKESNELDPSSYKEAIEISKSDCRIQAIDREMASLNKNPTSDIVDKPINKKSTGCKWIFEKKDGIPGVEKARYKARLVTRDFCKRNELISLNISTFG